MHATKPFDGSFILAPSNKLLSGKIEGAHLLDIAPTLLELGGYELITVMQAKSLVAEKLPEAESDIDLTAEEDDILRERLSGFGYIS